MGGSMKRRDFLKNGAATCLGFGLSQLVPLELLASSSGDKKVIVLFMRGAWDGLNIIPPKPGTADWKIYTAKRPTIHIRGNEQLPLAGYEFGMHPSLVNLHRYFKQGKVAIIPRAGSLLDSRSHFEQQDAIESGTDTRGSAYLGSSGYLARAYGARYKTLLESGKGDDKWGYSLSEAPILALKPRDIKGLSFPYVITNVGNFGNIGARGVSSVRDLDDRFKGFNRNSKNDNCQDANGTAIERRLCLLSKKAVSGVSDIKQDISTSKMESGTNVAARMTQACKLLKTSKSRIVALDMQGWDHHVNLWAPTEGKTPKGALATRLSEFDVVVDAFMKNADSKTILVVMSEFGRTLNENPARGTDHGRGGVAFVMGASVNNKNASIKRWGITQAEANASDQTSLAVEVSAQGDLRHVMARVMSEALGMRYAVTKSVFEGSGLPNVDALKIFG